MLLVLLILSLVWPVGAAAQGVTTSAVTGVVKDAQGAVIPGATVTAVHQPSGSTYEAVSDAEGRFSIPGMRIGGPYTITAALSGFRAEAQNNISLTLGVAQDVSFTLALASVAETVTVIGRNEPGLQLDPYGRRDLGHARRAGDAAHRVRTHQRHHAPDAAVRRLGHVCRPGQPDEQHHGGRLVLQQLVRPRRPAG